MVSMYESLRALGELRCRTTKRLWLCKFLLDAVMELQSSFHRLTWDIRCRADCFPGCCCKGDNAQKCEGLGERFGVRKDVGFLGGTQGLRTRCGKRRRQWKFDPRYSKCACAEI